MSRVGGEAICNEVLHLTQDDQFIQVHPIHTRYFNRPTKRKQENLPSATVGDFEVLECLAAAVASFEWIVPGEELDQIRVTFFGEFDTDTGDSDK